MRRLIVVALLALAGCNSQPAPPVIVYVPASMEQTVGEHLRSAGMDATLVSGDSMELTTRVIEKNDSPRADILITDNAVDIWRAGDRGALRPLDDNVLAEAPAQLRDPDGAWVALRFRPLLLQVRSDQGSSELASYSDLGNPEWGGKLCLSSSALPANRALLSMLIDELGVKPAERIARRWARNLAASPFASREDLVDAIGSGKCLVTIATQGPRNPEFRVIRPDPLYFDIDAIGVSRHAEHPDLAHSVAAELRRRLLVLDPELLRAAGGSNASVIGWHAEEARLLAERAGYR
ncbi:MAG: ABC transporter substrate-binding protein [Woeseiaceae bacterium]